VPCAPGHHAILACGSHPTPVTGSALGWVGGGGSLTRGRGGGGFGGGEGVSAGERVARMEGEAAGGQRREKGAIHGRDRGIGRGPWVRAGG
jgi:hypothetical protein